MQDIFLCPECDEKAGVCNKMWIKGLSRIDLFYFVCAKCQTVYYDKMLIRKCITGARTDNLGLRRIPYNILYQEANALLEETMKHRTEKMGYRFVRFRKKDKK